MHKNKPYVSISRSLLVLKAEGFDKYQLARGIVQAAQEAGLRLPDIIEAHRTMSAARLRENTHE